MRATLCFGRLVALTPSLLLVLLAAPAGHAEAPPAIAPLSDSARAILLGSPEDPPPPKLNGVSKAQEGIHYVTGNEWNLHLLQKALTGLGGGYVGVGSDQAYLLMGWQRPEIAWFMDYDPVIKDIHAIYRAFFLTAPTPEAFVGLWDLKQAKESNAVLERFYASEPETKEVSLRMLKRYRGAIAKRLRLVGDTMRRTRTPSFLNDQATYDYIVAMLKAGRVRPMTGNLLAKAGVRGIGEAARKLGVPVRAMYVSNAEQYWAYTDAFRDNIRAMHVDDRSLLVRTLLTWKRNQDYRYNVQPWANFIAWLDKPWVHRVHRIVPPRVDKGKEPEFLVTAQDPDKVEAELKRRFGGRIP